MASLSLNPSNSTSTNKDEVYIAAMPLRATKGPAQLLLSAAFSFNIWQLQHFMLILKPSNSQVLVFDFQSQDPEDIYVALAALSGRAIPGTILTRKISKLPKQRCWFIVLSQKNNAVEASNSLIAAGVLICALGNMIVVIIPMVWPKP